jgi:hypothetical protein
MNKARLNSEKQLIWDWRYAFSTGCSSYVLWRLARADSERWRLVHITFGTRCSAMVVFRLVGLSAPVMRGSPLCARPRVIHLPRAFLRRPQPYAGHNPVGIAIMVLLGLIVVRPARTSDL